MSRDVATRIQELLDRNADDAARALFGIQASNEHAALEHRVNLTMTKLMGAKALIEEAKPLLHVELHESPLLQVAEYEPRTWRERLLSWPWRPWQRTRKVWHPDPNFYRFPAKGELRGGYDLEVWVAHPETAKRIREVAREHGVEL